MKNTCALAFSGISLLIAGFLAEPVLAHDDHPLELAVFGTMWDGKDDPGWGAGVKFNVPVHEHVGVELRGAWVGGISTPPDSPKMEVDAVPLDLGLNFPLISHSMVTPFVAGGASWVFYYPEHGFDDDDEVGWYAGGGVRIGEERGWGGLVEVLYRGVDVDYKKDGRSFDSDLDGLTANLGVNYSW